MRTLTRRWTVLNYAVCEPNQWTCRTIAEDLGDDPKHVGMAARFLEMSGLIVKGEKIGRAHTLFPTPKGVEALHTAS